MAEAVEFADFNHTMKMARSLSGSSVSHVTANSIYDCFILRAQWLVPSMTARKFDITKPALGAFVLLYCGLTLYINVLGAQLLIARMYLRSGGVERSAVVVAKGVERRRTIVSNEEHFVWPFPKAFYDTAYPCGKPRQCSWWIRYRFEFDGRSYEKRQTVDCVDLKKFPLGAREPLLIDRSRPEQSELRDWFDGFGTVMAALLFDGIPLSLVVIAMVQDRLAKTRRRKRQRERSAARRAAAGTLKAS
jgi:hypothetical protein